jgi:hypothetical protein
VSDVGILIVDDDIASQRALKNVLDSEGWRVRIVPLASQAFPELATGSWNLAIVNVALAGVDSPLFIMLKELVQAASPIAKESGPLETPTEVPVLGVAGNGSPRKSIRVLFLVPVATTKYVQPILEQEGLPYAFKPYHLHDFLEKVSELLVEAGAIVQPLRSIGGFVERKNRGRDVRSSRNTRRNSMFASREDYQMSEEEMAEFERTEEEERKKREKALRDREHLG